MSLVLVFCECGSVRNRKQFTLEPDIGHILKGHVNSQTKKIRSEQKNSELSIKTCGVNVAYVLLWKASTGRQFHCLNFMVPRESRSIQRLHRLHINKSWTRVRLRACGPVHHRITAVKPEQTEIWNFKTDLFTCFVILLMPESLCTRSHGENGEKTAALTIATFV